jgi:glycerol-3-phosphate dehydrogenase (NAD(P)+)
MKVAVIGTTAWGTTLSLLLQRKGLDVTLWARTEEEAERLNRDRGNPRLPGFILPKELCLTASMEKALHGAGLVILAVPSQSMRQNARLLKGYVARSMLILSVTKGLELGSGKRMSQVIAEELAELSPNICVLSGPNLSQEVARGLPATAVIAAAEQGIAERVQAIMASPHFRLYTQTDVVGVELGGVLKNIIALAAGMCDGLGYGANTKASLVTRGLAEITRFGVACGASPPTFSGLAGMGDLVATCFSPLSRNRSLGEALAKGQSLPDALSSVRGTAEGVDTTVAARKSARQLGVEMPIAEQVYRVLFEGLKVEEAVPALMEREFKSELHGLGF